MKKIFTLIAAAILGFGGAQAQTVTINKTDGSKVTLDASEITSIEFAPKVDTTEVHSFGAGTAYLLVSSSYFTNSYYGNQCSMTVLQAGDQYLAKFEDPQWGSGLFNITLDRNTISGTGTLSVANPHSGGSSAYNATMSGTMTDIKMTVEMGTMGTVTINWIYGKAPQIYTIAGTYAATDSINVGGSFPYLSAASDEYTVTANSDGTINLAVPSQQYNGTVMGDLTLSGYTIKDIAWSDSAQAFYRAYKNDSITFHFTAEKNGTKSIDKDYIMDKDVCAVTVKLGDDGKLYVNNNYQMGAMPFEIYGTFVGTKKETTNTGR